MNKRSVGTKYEQLAAKYLTDNGLEILTMNYRCRIGEIDIVARNEDYLVFCEVKYRSNSNYGYPEEAVDARKQHKIKSTASWFLNENPSYFNDNIRFDVISILNNKITHIKDAF